ncbi:MAG: CHAD domain-containing protein [Syntrophales bacterium]|jgi:CHAD domain-containing protein|nr:CHAD domain-containing protein [Syntrophales bacterium]
MKAKTLKKDEYRFLLPNSGMEQAILASLRALGCEVQTQRTINQEDIYLDTFDWRLFRRGLSLRFSRTAGKAHYTLKIPGPIKGDPAGHLEIECAAGEKIGEAWDIKETDINGKIAEIIYPRRLLGHIAVRARRRTFKVVHPDGTVVEIAFVSSAFQAEAFQKPASCRLCEIALDFTKGTSATLEAMTKNITEKFVLLPCPQSMLETAIERLGISFPAKNPPPELIVSADDRLDIAVKKILSFQLRRLQENIPGTVADVDTEFVHQARVATRRMRSLLRLFTDAVPKRSADYFAGELLWLGSLFGAVRDLDVFSLNVVKFRNDIALASQRTTELLLRQIQGERAARLATLKEELASTRCRIFFLRLSTFTTRKPAIRPLAPNALSKAAPIASSVIFEHFDKAIALGKLLLLNPKLRNFHKLRIQFKKLRYASEFFNPAFDGALSSFITDAVKIQDCLGELQDTVFTKELISGLLKKWRGSVMEPRLIFILGEIHQLQQEIARARQSEFKEIWDQFDRPETVLKLTQALGTEKPPEA